MLEEANGSGATQALVGDWVPAFGTITLLPRDHGLRVSVREAGNL